MITTIKPNLCDTNQLADELGIAHTAITFDGEFLNIDLDVQQKTQCEMAVKNHVPNWSK